ncbi:MAG: class I SAM-dependent methyltransferase [Candidatus Symbiothrix sp.]|jgi:SAM-dependent methyltransferase|nr:class I SAM-dependent methyltransferase [Candidatus Symbiothrix sp.]
MENYIDTLTNLAFDEDAYKRYLNNWLNGIKEEMYFWKNYIETACNAKNTECFQNDRPFKLDQYIDLPETSFLDVGSGPFSSCGLKTHKTKLHFSAVDPLAVIYKHIKIQNKITTGITPEFAVSEKLTDKYDINTYDIVHMSNALDHSFQPIIALLEMLFVCKVGGKVILSHFRNEAENESYTGFHQWNLCIENSEFIIWRPDIKYNVSKMISEYADVFVEDNLSDLHFNVILSKKSNPPQILELKRRLIFNLDEKIFEFLSNMIVNDIENFGLPKIVKLKQFARKTPILNVIARKSYKFFRNLSRRYNKNT